MKALIKIIFIIYIVLSLSSCNTNAAGNKEQITAWSAPDNYTVYLPALLGDDYDLLTDHYWGVSDGRYLEDQSVSSYNWVGDMTPRVIFRKLELPEGSVLYQRRLRNEYFMLLYQTDNKTLLYKLEDSFESRVFYVTIDSNISTGIKNLVLSSNGYLYSNQDRAGGTNDINHPLAGIWGRAPNLTEYRVADYSGCYYYMEIDKEIPFWAVRRGSYVLKQTGENTFETSSPFPDGGLRLEVINDRNILLRPLFTTPEGERGLTGLLSLYRSSLKISEINQENIY